MGEEFKNALAWFKAAPGKLVGSAAEKAKGMAEWIWVVLQGDFADEQSTAQVATSTIISMIPLVDQICDVRDIVANCKKINSDTSNKWAWVALVLTLIGLFPTLGSLVKGCFKILFAYGRKGVLSAGKAALDSGMWKAVEPYVNAGIKELNDFLARPATKKWMSRYRIDNPYKYLAEELRKVGGKLTVGSLTGVFDKGIASLKKLLGHVQKWGGDALSSKAGQLLEMVGSVRRKADDGIGKALAPVQDLINKLANRLELEHAQTYRAMTNAVNPHQFTRLGFDVEVTALKKAPPDWVTVGKVGKYPAPRRAPAVPAGHFSIGADGPNGVTDAFLTFTKDVRPDRLPPGTVIYRVVDPTSADNSYCWMTKAEFLKLNSKANWRDRFAVWANWNRNGEYVKYTVPRGEGLPVWRGTPASQEMADRAGNVVKADDKGNTFWVDGGAEQIVVNPADLKRAGMSKRELTNWTDGSADIEVSLVGVPSLTNWRTW
jgi:hypothetical protein